MKEIIKSVLKQKRMKYLIALVSLVLLAIIMNITFAAFSSRKTSELANIKIGKMNYLMKINTTETTKISALSNSITMAEVSISSLNRTSSKYELIYEVCEGEVCTKNIPEGLKVEYSSETTSPITGEIGKDEAKVIRVALINNTGENITIKFNINAGYSHNELALAKLITSEYVEKKTIIFSISGSSTSSSGATITGSKALENFNSIINITTSGGTINSHSMSGNTLNLSVIGTSYNNGSNVVRVNESGKQQPGSYSWSNGTFIYNGWVCNSNCQSTPFQQCSCSACPSCSSSNVGSYCNQWSNQVQPGGVITTYRATCIYVAPYNYCPNQGTYPSCYKDTTNYSYIYEITVVYR